MNEYKKIVLKRNLTAIGIAALMLLSAIGIILVILIIGVLLDKYLPYAVATILFLGMVFVISIPIRDVLKDRERAREYQRLKNKQKTL